MQLVIFNRRFDRRLICFILLEIKEVIGEYWDHFRFPILSTITPDNLCSVLMVMDFRVVLLLTEL